MAPKKRTKKAKDKRKPKRKAQAAKDTSKRARMKTSGQRSKVRKGQIGASEKAVVVSYDPKGLGARSGGQAGDLQGISDLEGAGSESVEELLEEGSSFEAEVLQGVEQAGDLDEREVRTHET